MRAQSLDAARRHFDKARALYTSACAINEVIYVCVYIYIHIHIYIHTHIHQYIYIYIYIYAYKYIVGVYYG